MMFMMIMGWPIDHFTVSCYIYCILDLLLHTIRKKPEYIGGLARYWPNIVANRLLFVDI